MIFQSILLFILCYQCVKGEPIENISIESALDGLAIPTKIVNDFLKNSATILPYESFNPHNYINGSKTRYEHSNRFMPLILNKQLYKFRKNEENESNISGESLNSASLKKLNVKNKGSLRFKDTDSLNTSNLNKYSRSLHTDNKQIEIELLKVNNNTSFITNYNSLHERIKKLPISNNFNFDTNFNKYFKNSNKNRKNRINENIFNDRNRENMHYFRNQINETKKKEDNSEEKMKMIHKKDKIKYHSSQIISSPIKINATPNTTFPTLKNYNYTENIQGHKFNEPNGIKSKETIQFFSTSNPYIITKDLVDVKQRLHKPSSQIQWSDRNYEFPDAQGSLEESFGSSDYNDEIDKLRRRKRINRKYPRLELLQRDQKENREIYDDFYDNEENKYFNGRSKSRYREKLKPVKILKSEGMYDDRKKNSHEFANDNSNKHNLKQKNMWNEVSNLNVDENDQIEKPKLHIVPVNILSNFDHATALDSSQGFDITNVMLTGLIRDGSLVSTVNPILSSSHYVVSSTVKPQLGITSITPNIIVDQNLFPNPIQTVITPHNLQKNILNSYLQNTVTPTILAVTPSSLHASSSTVPNLQYTFNQLDTNLPYDQQFVSAKPIVKSLGNILQSAQANTNTQIYVSPIEVQSQNLNPQQHVELPKSRSNFKSNHRAKFNSNNGEFLASTKLFVENNNLYSKMKSDTNSENYSNTFVNKEAEQTLNTLLHPTIVPAILHTGIGVYNNPNQQLLTNPIVLQNPQLNQQLIKLVNESLKNTIKQLKFNVQNNRYELSDTSNTDSTGAANNDINRINTLQKAYLPILGANNVEIINPNLKTNTYAINHIPTAFVSTPVSILTTNRFITPEQSLTPITKDFPDDRPLYNPINFVPNYDLIKNQTLLNNNNKHFIPLSTIGNSYDSQEEKLHFVNKHKINSDLAHFAKEMLKESLKTIYNSQKWNNDPRSLNNVSLIDNSNFVKLRNNFHQTQHNREEFNLHRDVFEGHQTENKIRKIKSRPRYNRPDSSSQQSTLDHETYSEIFKKPHHFQYNRHKSQINDFLTPPKINAHVYKNGHFKKFPTKRPPSQGLRLNAVKRPRHRIVSSKSKNILKSKRSTNMDYKYPVRSNQKINRHSEPNYEQIESNNFQLFNILHKSNNNYKASIEDGPLERYLYNQGVYNLINFLMKNNQLSSDIESCNDVKKKI